ncbi:MAG TPA: isoprenylcysteine carboxylmethyltransferase family protein [Candidatus Dormibacteraeota bacterium]
MAQAVAIPARQGELGRRVEEIRFLVFGRALPAVLFALLGYRVLMNLLSQVHDLPKHGHLGGILAGPLTTGVYLAFCAIPVGIYLVRPRPKARDGRMVARAAGLVGTTMLLVVGAFPLPVILVPPVLIRDAAVPLTLGAFCLGVYGLLYLRRSLSIIPEARRLVTSGPYRVVRHPLYAAEILAAVALVLARPGLWATLTLAPFIVVQMLRARFEESLLAKSFPEYATYAAHTARLIPFVW